MYFLFIFSNNLLFTPLNEVTLIWQKWTISLFKYLVIDNAIEIFVKEDYIYLLIGLNEDTIEYESIDDLEIIVIHYF